MYNLFIYPLAFETFFALLSSVQTKSSVPIDIESRATNLLKNSSRNAAIFTKPADYPSLKS